MVNAGKKWFDPGEAAQRIKEKALRLGFSACGIAKVCPLPEDSEYLSGWLQKGHNGRMAYMGNHADKRNDPSLLVPGARSVVVVLLNYATGHTPASQQFNVARYAHGVDYHFVVKQYLGELLRFINEEIAPVQGRAFCDSAPVFERRWAYEAGLGWIGLNHCLIHPKFGSFCFIGELIIDLDLKYDAPLEGDCGFCGHCVSACPTNAIQSKGFLQAEKCVSYLTVELKDVIPESFHDQLQNRIAGCDRCQDVCPWNKKAVEYTSPLWHVDEAILNMTDEDWKTLDKPVFNLRFRKSPLTRLGYAKLRQNCDIIIKEEARKKDR